MYAFSYILLTGFMKLCAQTDEDEDMSESDLESLI